MASQAALSPSVVRSAEVPPTDHSSAEGRHGRSPGRHRCRRHCAIRAHLGGHEGLDRPLEAGSSPRADHLKPALAPFHQPATGEVDWPTSVRAALPHPLANAPVPRPSRRSYRADISRLFREHEPREAEPIVYSARLCQSDLQPADRSANMVVRLALTLGRSAGTVLQQASRQEQKTPGGPDGIDEQAPQ